MVLYQKHGEKGLQPTYTKWSSNLLFRDYLRTHPLVLQEYQQLKRDLVEKHHFDRAAYTAAKEAFIIDAIKKAENDKNNL
ncbi:GrpB family protein [Priestia aryabhattai]|uniref:GrpB family protein n=1 Tax=Priestia aryabhattai TaxID=412384 RepID=UPI003D2C0BD8